jgi:hypothetical protein
VRISELKEAISELAMQFDKPLNDEECIEIIKVLSKVVNLYEEDCSIKQMHQILKPQEKVIYYYNNVNNCQGVNALYIGKKYFNYIIENSKANVIKTNDNISFVMAISVMDKDTEDVILTANLDSISE